MTSSRARKFKAYLVAVVALVAAGRWVQPASFSALAAAIVATFGAFAGAHALTDIKAGRSGELPRG